MPHDSSDRQSDSCAEPPADHIADDPPPSLQPSSGFDRHTQCSAQHHAYRGAHHASTHHGQAFVCAYTHTPTEHPTFAPSSIPSNDPTAMPGRTPTLECSPKALLGQEFYSYDGKSCLC